MPLPKALLCVLGDYVADLEEAKLRQAGFATAVLHWNELINPTHDWMQLAGVLDEPAVQAWVIAGEPADFTEDVLGRVSLLALALRRKTQPATALVLCEEGPVPALPPLLGHVTAYHSLEPFAARLMAARFKPGLALSLPLHLRPWLDPLIGLWLEVAPAKERAQPDFTVGVLNADITAFGVGPRGAIPARSRLAYPMLGVKGAWEGRAFSACAAKNALSEATACFCKVEGIPHGVFLGRYLDETQQDQEVVLVRFFA